MQRDQTESSTILMYLYRTERPEVYSEQQKGRKKENTMTVVEMSKCTLSGQLLLRRPRNEQSHLYTLGGSQDCDWLIKASHC